jgi:methionyl-tRNA formyltransferase
MNIVFFGTPRFAVPTLRHLLDSPHRVTGVVTQPDRPRGRGQKVSPAPVKALALERGVPIIQPERLKPPDVADALRAWSPDLAVVAAYGRIIPEALIAIPRLGMINVHASLLPKYRGAAPVHRAVIDGEAETGVTIMRVVKELDAGAMFAKATRTIGIDETSEGVEDALAELGARLLVVVVDQIEAGSADEEAQDPARSTYAAKITREDGLVDWSRSALAIHNQVRGLYPWPHAYTFLNGKRLIVLRTSLETTGPSREADSGVRGAGGAAPRLPGTIVDVTAAAIQVATGDGALTITDVQPEGRRPMPVRDFVAGHSITAGDRFGPP